MPLLDSPILRGRIKFEFSASSVCIRPIIIIIRN